MRSVFAFLCLLLISGNSISQNLKNVYFHVDKISIKEKAILDSSRFSELKKNAQDQFALLGYTGLKLIDSTFKTSSVHYYYQYDTKFDKVILNCINDSSYRIKPLKNSNYTSTLRDLNKKINLLENNGYPFASIKITNQKEAGKSLYMDYRIDSGVFFIINEIILKSESKLHEKTILNLIDINVGDRYNEQKIRDISQVLSSSKLYTLKRPPELIFKEGKAILYLFIEKSKSSNADGYVGLQQDQTTQKLALNGYVNLQLYNSFNRAEIIDLNWKNNPDKTQKLRALFRYPFIFNSPIGIRSDINLQKQDTTFIKSDLIFDLTYLNPKFEFSLFDQIEGSSVISKTIPTGFRDYKKNTVGLRFRYKPHIPILQEFFHPSFQIMGGFFNYRSDTIDNNKQKVQNSKYKLTYAHQIDFLGNFHLNNNLSFQGLSSSIALSRNELLYFGGLKSVRGFYELELFGNNVWILNSEIEFTPIKALSFKILYDYSVYENQGSHYTDSFGFGFGLNNNSSTLEIIVANGSIDQTSVDLKNTKIHIGFKSSF